MNVLVIGAGTMGSGIALVVADAGYSVVLIDSNQEALQIGMASIEKSLSRLVQKEKISLERKSEILSLISPSTDLSQGRGCLMAIEAASESMVVKHRIFKELDGILGKDAIFATNTSSLSIEQIASVVNHPERVIGLHFFNPPSVMKLVEIISSVLTSPKTVQFTEQFIQTLGKDPVNVKESPGFVVNRILIPMINEAVSVFSEGVASANDIDKAMMLGANHPIGPLALADLIGIDIVHAIMETLQKDFESDKYAPHPLLQTMIRENKLGRKTKQGFYPY